MSTEARRRQISAYTRLMQMPAVFTLNTLVRWTGLSRDAAKVTVSRWAARGLLELAGPRSGIYFNRVVDPAGHQATPVKALVMLYPSATLCGVSVLHAAGWTTQIPSSLHVAIEAQPSYAQINGVVMWPRPVSWFQAMKAVGAWYDEDGAADDMPTYGLRALQPAWALADLYADAEAGGADTTGRGRPWAPDEDDLDIPAERQAAVVAACQHFQVVLPWVDSNLRSRHR